MTQLYIFSIRVSVMHQNHGLTRYRYFLVIVATFLATAGTARADEPIPFVISCANCETISDFVNRMNSHLNFRKNTADTRDAVYMVVSQSSAKIAIAETWFESNPMFPGWTIPQIDLITETVVETKLADQVLIARAAIDKANVDDLPTVIYPNGSVQVGGGDYQSTAMLYMNGHPAVTMEQAEGTVPWSTLLSRTTSIREKLLSVLSSTVKKIFVKLEFADGSYGVFYVADSTTAGIHEVYYVDAEGNVIVIDAELLDEVEDVNLPAPDDASGEIDENAPHGGGSGGGGGGGASGGSWAATGSVSSGSFLITLQFPSGNGRSGNVIIEDIIN